MRQLSQMFYALVFSLYSPKVSGLEHNTWCTCVEYRISSIYTINVGTHKKDVATKNRVNQGYLVVLMGENRIEL